MMLPLISYGQHFGWNIVRSSDDTLSECTLKACDDSLLTLSSHGIEVSLPVDSINVLFRDKESYLVVGGAIGMIVSVPLGFLLAEAIVHKGEGIVDLSGIEKALLVMAVGAIGFTAGGLIGESSGRDELYDLTATNHQERIIILRKMISKAR